MLKEQQMFKEPKCLRKTNVKGKQMFKENKCLRKANV